MDVNNKIFLRNIDTLREMYKLELCDLEKKAGVTTGYFSDLGKNPDKLPETELLLGLSGIFNVGMDVLMLFEINELSFDEQKLLRFFEKLRDQTVYGMIKWHMKNTKSLSYGKGALLKEGEVFNRPPQTRYNGYPFEAEISENHRIELVPIINTGNNGTAGFYGFEVYFVKEDKTEVPVCATYSVHPAVWTKIFELANNIYRSKVRLEDEARDIINNYLGEK